MSFEFKHSDDIYNELLVNILIKGEERNDRTGTGTLSVFGTQSRYDLDCSFPLLTTKEVHWKSVVHELLWFLKGDTNIKYLQNNGVNIWNEWRMPYTLDREIITVEQKTFDYVPYDGDFSAKSNIKDEEKLKSIWRKLMKRCYDKSAHNYNQYGGLGISVSKEWHNVDNFIRDVKELPHWWYKENNWNDFELDKDYYKSNQYNKESCVWLRKEENNYYTKSANPLSVTTSDGEELLFITNNVAAKELGISKSTLNRFVNNLNETKTLKGKNKKFDGYVFKNVNKDKLFRLRLIDTGDLGPVYGKQWRDFNGVDQIKNVIQNIKDNPYSRRHIVSAWNPTDIGSMALPPCHVMFQFYVSTDGKLSCHLYQRSADVFLGVPFNIASYGLLTYMIANECGLLPGELIHSIGDAHLYKNHIEQAKLQLERTSFPVPIVNLKRGVEALKITPDDIYLKYYEHHPKIPAKVSV